ncbi:MAG: hypothetical protein RBR28_11620 [Lentimicrobium sp.]|jgi:endonuclease/exonuclease/phosphatase family metal-dependent hydrolase|nr:hypothetical protein [Lentimicrobium sp.]
MKLPKVLKLFLLFVVLLVGLFVLFLGYQTITAYRPAPVETVNVSCTPGTVKDTLSLISWNIGYAGLGKEMDFFYEGGTMTRPTKEQAQNYLKGILSRLSSFNNPDFLLLQEVDTLAHRSYNVNQYKAISAHMYDYCAAFAMNYKAWVPMPVSEPMGRVRAGIMTLSRQAPVELTRYAFETGYSWPMSLFMLNRCFLAARFRTENQKQLVLVNIHNSAFSDAAEIRGKELAALKTFVISEYQKGNAVIVGGDWNQNPPEMDTTAIAKTYKFQPINPPIPEDFLPAGWQFAYDPEHSTNRHVDRPYTEGINFSTLIDFYMLSPNVELLWVKAIPFGFKVSDHQPVQMQVVLN